MNGQKLLNERKNRGLTRKDVGRETDLTEETIMQIELHPDTVNPTLKTLKKLCNYYGIPISEILQE